MTETLRGWCIGYNHQGAAPTLSECEVITTDTPGLFTESVGVGQFRVHTQGVTFFSSVQIARRGLIEKLQDAKEGHLLAIAYIEGQIQACQAIIKDEEEKQAEGASDA